MNINCRVCRNNTIGNVCSLGKDMNLPRCFCFVRMSPLQPREEDRHAEQTVEDSMPSFDLPSFDSGSSGSDSSFDGGGGDFGGGGASSDY